MRYCSSISSWSMYVDKLTSLLFSSWSFVVICIVLVFYVVNVSTVLLVANCDMLDLCIFDFLC